MSIPVVFSSEHALHVPDGEVWVGVRIPGTELPARGEAIAVALREAGHHFVSPRPIDDEELEAVHSPDLVEFLRTAWQRWQASDYVSDPGQDQVVPYAFPLSAMTSGRPPRRPSSVGALTGMYAMDTMTLIGEGTWEAARAAAAAAVTAAMGVLRRMLLDNRAGDSTWFLLNKQAATAGVAVVIDEEQESPLGPIRVTISCEELDTLIDWLVPEA